MTDNRQLTIMGWEITNDCNLHCPHCYNPIVRNGVNELTRSECLEIIKSAAKLGVVMIGLTGGEPLLRPELEELISVAYESYKIQSGVTTNGVLLDLKRGRSLKKAGLQNIQISLDGTTAERNHSIRKTTEDEFNKTLEAIQICKKLDMNVYIAMLLGADNIDDGHQMLDVARKLGVQGIRFCGFTPEGRAQSKVIQKRFQIGDKLSELHDFIVFALQMDEMNVLFDPGFGPVPPDYWYHDCIAGKETCYIKANGDVYPCTAMLHDQFIVGNVKDRPLEDIWNDSSMSTMASNSCKAIKGICAQCDNSENCKGGCRFLTYAHTGSYDESFPFCLYQHKATDKIKTS